MVSDRAVKKENPRIRTVNRQKYNDQKTLLTHTHNQINDKTTKKQEHENTKKMEYQGHSIDYTLLL